MSQLQANRQRSAPRRSPSGEGHALRLLLGAAAMGGIAALYAILSRFSGDALVTAATASFLGWWVALSLSSVRAGAMVAAIVFAGTLIFFKELAAVPSPWGFVALMAAIVVGWVAMVVRMAEHGFGDCGECDLF